MKRKLILSNKNNLEFEIAKDDKNFNWYFVNWDETLDEDGNYSIYTNNESFKKKILVFKSKDWSIICSIGNLINGMFHNYFGISNSYPINSAISIDNLLKKNDGGT